ncbi:unnamed protein product [Psylliodes chrysocephalus]|uniref:Uncharacterized protein n=1 Tax=Psylliodes chrysocephalus TaxID=3402493 RepID=A0A9P0GKP4_9CUCU|nr:unnamed protein product [Psylliodes chrysocephala]
MSNKKNNKNTRKTMKRGRQSDSSSSDSESDLVESTRKKYKFFKTASSESDIDMESDYDEMDKLLDDEKILCDDYILVRFPTKKTVVYYVGQVIQLAEYGEFVVKYLRHLHNRFHFPDVDDISTIARSDIEAKLPRPTSVAGNTRLASFLNLA